MYVAQIAEVLHIPELALVSPKQYSENFKASVFVSVGLPLG